MKVMLFPFALKQFLTSFHVDANFLGAFSNKKNKSYWRWQSSYGSLASYTSGP